MKILVIDDNQALLDEVKTILVFNGHEVDCIDNAVDGFKMLQDTEYDVMLIDYKMPDYDGLWLMKNARLPRKTKVLLITSHVNRTVINEMFKRGIAGYVIKPFDEAELLHHLEFHTSRRVPA